MNRFFILLLLPLLLSSCALFRPAAKVAVNQKAETFLLQGKRLMRGESYPEAMDAFEQAIGPEYHRSSTAAIYLSGLAAYYSGYYDIAKKRFARLKREYPKSRYVEEVDYHTALIQLADRRYNEKEKGVEGLTELAQNAKQGRIRSDALKQLRAAFFEEFTLPQMQTLERLLSGDYKMYWAEAMVHRQLKAGELDAARATYETYKAGGGEMSDFLKKLSGEKEGESISKAFEPNIARIALALPLHLEETGDIGFEVPRKVQLALEFYEGFEIAVKKYNEDPEKNVYLEVFDTKRDTAVTRSFSKRLDKLVPTILVGAIYNNQSRILSEWAESRSVPMIVPISPAEDLVEGKQFTFLGHPSPRVQGGKMASYAFKELGLSRIYMFQDGSAATRGYADGFARTFTELGGRVDSMTFSSNYELAIKQIPNLVSDIEDDSAGVYIPIMNNEEAAGLVVNVLRQKNKELPVMGSPHFKSKYAAIPRDIKSSYSLLFSTSHLVNKNSLPYWEMEQSYLRKYGYPPTDWVIQGYDLANYLLSQLEKYDPNQEFTFDTFLRVGSKFPSLHIDYEFNSGQINKSVNIGQYEQNGVKKIDY